jgi:hypothetical protein
VRYVNARSKYVGSAIAKDVGMTWEVLSLTHASDAKLVCICGRMSGSLRHWLRGIGISGWSDQPPMLKA